MPQLAPERTRSSGGCGEVGQERELCLRLELSARRSLTALWMAVKESLPSAIRTWEHEVLSRHHFATRSEARAVVVACAWIFTTTAAGIAPPDCSHPTTTRRPPQNNRPRHNRLQTVSVEDPCVARPGKPSDRRRWHRDTRFGCGCATESSETLSDPGRSQPGCSTRDRACCRKEISY